MDSPTSVNNAARVAAHHVEIRHVLAYLPEPEKIDDNDQAQYRI
jgi:hypothetical protein